MWKCSIQYGSKIDNDNGSVWINGNAKNCKYWAHLYYTGLSCRDEDKEMFAKITKYYCKRHKPCQILRPKYALISDLTYHQTPNKITKASTKIYQKFEELVILSIFCYNFPPGVYLSRVHNKKHRSYEVVKYVKS